MKNKLIEFIRSEIVLCVALLLAVVSSIFTLPGKEILTYIDFNTLFLLFSLMCVMAGFKEMGIFEICSRFLLDKTKSTGGILSVLIFLPFFFSMIITNDVALITFVPLALITLKLSGLEKLAVVTIVLQTLAANLGSMLLPMGNPQNLYLYNLAGISLGQFILVMLPYTCASFLLLALCVLVIHVKNRDAAQSGVSNQIINEDTKSGKKSTLSVITTILCFVLSMLSVFKVLQPAVLFMIVFVLYLIFNRKILLKVDYSLLATFVGFFVFVGNIKSVPQVSAFLHGILLDHEVPVAVAASQVISNVPAALLLSGFTQKYELLIAGTNLGGLGTLIASMASLISYKQISAAYPERRGKYFAVFTVFNIVFLAVLMVLWALIS